MKYHTPQASDGSNPIHHRPEISTNPFHHESRGTKQLLLWYPLPDIIHMIQK